jgi:cell division protein FtsX
MANMDLPLHGLPVVLMKDTMAEVLDEAVEFIHTAASFTILLIVAASFAVLGLAILLTIFSP